MTDPSEVVLLKAREVAEMLSIDIDDVWRLASAGQLEKRYIGRGTRQYRIPLSSVKRYVDSLPTEPVEDV